MQPNSPTAPIAFAEALASLNILTSQTANFTFTNDEMTQALTTAWNDSFVVTVAYDSSLVYQVGTWVYAIPATMVTVKEIYVILPDNAQEVTPYDTTNYPVKVSQDLYEIVNGNIQFLGESQNYLYDTYTLYLKGNYKLGLSDSLPTVNLINYVLWLAVDTLMRQLLLKSTFVFLRNDATIPAIVAAQKVTSEQVLVYKQRLFREFEST
jgi:hypothetical protein